MSSFQSFAGKLRLCSLSLCLVSISMLTAPRGLEAQTKKKPAGQGMTSRGVTRETYSPKQEGEFEEEKKNAVIVAPNYKGSGLASLRFTYNDAAELRQELERQGYKVHIVPSTEATADGVREALAKQKTYLEDSKQATLLFAFMGHGFQDSHGKNYLMTYGADTENMDKEALAVDEVEQMLNQTGARRKMILIDACRSTAGTRDAAAPRSMAEFRAAEGMSILLATRPGAYSYEDPELSHGVFTYFVLEGLRGKAAGKDGYITFQDLSGYVQKNVSDYAEKKDMAQKPLATMHDVGGDFLIATKPPAKPDEIHTLSAASMVSSDTPVMRSLGTNQAFFVITADKDVTLVDANTGQPYAILAEDPSQLKDKVEMAKHPLHWYGGHAPDGKIIQIVTETSGTDLARIWGRQGKHCPDEKPCSPTPYPLLPGEVRAQASSMNKMTGKVSKTLSGTLGAFGKKSTMVNGVAGTTDVVGNNGLITADNDKYVWVNFDLTSTLKGAPKP